MDHDALIEAIQLAYPQLWFACHVEHRTRRHGRLTDREAGLLAHVAAAGTEGASAGELARHLGIGAPALSQQLKRLQALGMLDVTADAADSRRRRVVLTPDGRAETTDASPLDRERLDAVLHALAPDAREPAVRGLVALADAARRLRLSAAGASPP